MEELDGGRLEVLAEKLIDDHYDLLKSLIYYRTSKGISLETVSERMDMSLDSVKEFEAYFSNPDLYTVRRYCLAIGVYLETKVIDSSS